jgi:ribonuclease R
MSCKCFIHRIVNHLLRQKVEKAERAHQLKPRAWDDEERKGPDQNLLKMILGPEEYKKARGQDSEDKPKLSKKLLFAEQSKLRDNDDYSEKNSDSLKDRRADRKDSKKRGKTENDSRGVRKTRLSQGRGKGKAR